MFDGNKLLNLLSNWQISFIVVALSEIFLFQIEDANKERDCRIDIRASRPVLELSYIL